VLSTSRRLNPVVIGETRNDRFPLPGCSIIDEFRIRYTVTYVRALSRIE
jgi:hypothetical protein